jgi:hypothetical protein
MARRSRLKARLRKVLPAVTVTLTTLPFTVWVPSAQAFFPPVWPVSPPVTVVPPVSPPPVIVVPPVSPPPFVPPPPPPVILVPPVLPPPVVVVPPPPPAATPEPATLATGLIGLAAAAGYGLKRRYGKKDGEEK